MLTIPIDVHEREFSAYSQLVTATFDNDEIRDKKIFTNDLMGKYVRLVFEIQSEAGNKKLLGIHPFNDVTEKIREY